MAWRAEVDGGGARALLTFLEAALPNEQQKRLLQMRDRPLTPPDLRQCANWLREIRSTSDPNAPTIRELLARDGGARVEPRATTPEEKPSEARQKYLAARRKKLLRLDEELRYGHLVKNVQTVTTRRELQNSLTSVKQHLSIGANMIVSRIVAFIVVYVVTKPLTDNETTRVVLGLGGAIGMMVIEMVLYIARAAKYEALEEQQRKNREGVFSST